MQHTHRPAADFVSYRPGTNLFTIAGQVVMRPNLSRSGLINQMKMDFRADGF